MGIQWSKLLFLSYMWLKQLQISDEDNQELLSDVNQINYVKQY
jgi:hypothetical protein